MEDPKNILLPLTMAKLLVSEGRITEAEQLQADIASDVTACEPRYQLAAHYLVDESYADAMALPGSFGRRPDGSSAERFDHLSP